MPEPTNDQIEEVEVIKIGDKEYSQSDLQSLVGLGEMAREVETRYNTKLDRVYPEYTKSTQKIKQYEQELEELRQANARQTQNTDSEITESTIREARDAARKLGIVTQEDFEERMSKGFRSQYLEQRQAEKLLDDMSRLEEQIDGTDGRPRFNKEDVLEYMRDSGVRNPMDAYELKYKRQTDEWRANQIIKSKQTGFYTTDTSSGDKQPPKVEINSGNLRQLIGEVMSS